MQDSGDLGICEDSLTSFIVGLIGETQNLASGDAVAAGLSTPTMGRSTFMETDNVDHVADQPFGSNAGIFDFGVAEGGDQPIFRQPQPPPTAMEEIAPSISVLEPGLVDSVVKGDSTVGLGVLVGGQEQQQQQLQQQQPDPASPFTSYQTGRSSYSSCSSYSNFSSSVPSVASTPSILSGLSTPANPKDAFKPTESEANRYGQVDGFTEQELFDALRRKLSSDNLLGEAQSQTDLKEEPATPPSTPSKLPRYKRAPHKRAERKRVEKIRQHLESLKSLLQLSSERSESKALVRANSKLRDLRAQVDRGACELQSLKDSLAELDAEQAALLDSFGSAESDAESDKADTITHSTGCQHERSLTLINSLVSYGRRRACQDAQFRLFHRLVGGLISSSYCEALADANDAETFDDTVGRWLTSLPIGRLRRELTDRLREVAVDY